MEESKSRVGKAFLEWNPIFSWDGSKSLLKEHIGWRMNPQCYVPF